MQLALSITALESVLQGHQSKPAPFANPAKSAAPAKEGSKAYTTANHFSVNYLSGIIRIRHGSRTRKSAVCRKLSNGGNAKGSATRQKIKVVLTKNHMTRDQSKSVRISAESKLNVNGKNFAKSKSHYRGKRKWG
jgi:hypothetical protein